MRVRFRALCLLSAFVFSSLPCFSQQRPLLTERARTVEDGHVLFDVGFEFLQDAVFPFSGLKGDLTNAGVIGARFGMGSRVEVQMLGTVRQFLNINQRFDAPGSGDLNVSGNSTSDFGNLNLATKVKLISGQQGRLVIASRFGVELPNTSNQKELGTDETNFFTQLLVEKRLNRVDLIWNVGLAILGDPEDAGAQDDLLTYGFAIVAEATPRLNLLAEIKWQDRPVRNWDRGASQGPSWDSIRSQRPGLGSGRILGPRRYRPQHRNHRGPFQDFQALVLGSGFWVLGSGF